MRNQIWLVNQSFPVGEIINEIKNSCCTRGLRSKSVSDSISSLGASRFVHVRSWTFHTGVNDFWTRRRSKNKLWNFQFQHIESQKIITRDNQFNIKYEVYFNVTLGWNQTDFMVIRAPSKTRRESSRDLSSPYHAVIMILYDLDIELTATLKISQSWNRISG